MNVEIVTVGTELLLGFTVDTNGAELGRALAAAGVVVARRTAVADQPEAVRDAVAEALARTGFVITTGGLGPTRDDVTKPAVAELFGRPLVLDQNVLHALEARFKGLGRWPMPDANRSQAQVPEGATILPNPRGTAPGLWVEDDRGRTVVMLPGVPSEMRGLLIEEVLPRIVVKLGGQAGPGGRVVLSHTLRTTGVAESALAERIGAFENDVAPITLAYLPGPDGVDLRLTAWGLAKDEAERRMGDAVALLEPKLGDHFYGTAPTDLAAVVLDLLRQRGRKLAVAESCTGGLLGQRLTAVPGASDVFVGGIVAYANAVKTALLDVPAATIETAGAVSEETVCAMARGACRAFGVPGALAVTGIAGPTGGTPEKPVGTVWVAAQVEQDVRALRRVLPGDRQEIRYRGAQAALDLMRRMLRER